MDRIPSSSKYYSQQYAVGYESNNRQFSAFDIRKHNDYSSIQQPRYATGGKPILTNSNTAINNISYNQHYGAASSTTSSVDGSESSIGFSGFGPQHSNFSSRNRYAPYYNRSYSQNSINNNSNSNNGKSFNHQYSMPLGHNTTHSSNDSGISSSFCSNDVDRNNNVSFNANISAISQNNSNSSTENDSSVTLQISNLDTSIDDHMLKQYLINKLKPITPILSFVFDGLSVAKIRLPSQYHAKQVVSNLHRKKVGHKRITVSYTKDSSTMEPSTLRCQVAGLLKDIPHYRLTIYKFRELFQSRFKTSISLMDLYDMKDICNITESNTEEKYICLRPELISSIENSELLDCLQHSVPYCSEHFKNDHRGWAEQEMEPLPNVFMTITHVRTIIYELLKKHKGEIPIASLVYCIEGELNVQIQKNENGVNLEHLIACVNGVLITTNKFGIKIVCWLKPEHVISMNSSNNNQNLNSSFNNDAEIGGGTTNRYNKYGNIIADPFSQISREIIEIIKMSPKSTMKFSRFIPAYHNYFGKQCRVADYGYTKLIELFEALPSIVQIMGDGENRQITLTHKCQLRRFTSDLLRIFRSQSIKSFYISHLAMVLNANQSKKFDITDYGVCDIADIVYGLMNSHLLFIDTQTKMISLPQRKQSLHELQKLETFASEVVELFRNASQYTIPFEKFACSYHYHFGYQCRLSDYGFLKLADLMEAITGVIEFEFSTEEDRKMSLSPKVAQRIFSEQLRDLVKSITGSSLSIINLFELLLCHKNKFGYQIQPQLLGLKNLWTDIKKIPYIEILHQNENYSLVCNHDNIDYKNKCYAACTIIMESGQTFLPITDFIKNYFGKYNDILNEHIIETMIYFIEIHQNGAFTTVSLSKLMLFLLKIISVLDNYPKMSIIELKTALNITINECFSFGFPNLLTLLQAFSDLFTVFVTSSPNRDNNFNSDTSVDIILNNNMCIYNLRNICHNSNIKTILDVMELYQNPQQTNLESMQTPSLAEQSFQQQDPEPSLLYNLPFTNNNNNASNEMINNLNIKPELFEKNSSIFNGNPHQNANFYENFNKYFEETQKKDVIQDIENIFGKPDVQQKRLYERTGRSSDIAASNVSNPLLDDIDIKFAKKRLLAVYFEPPKPDTPPANPIPFWLDPVWSNDPTSPLNDNINIPLPELKTFNVLPKLDSPTAMGQLTKHFNFDEA